VHVDEVVEQGLGALRDTCGEEARALLETLNGLDVTPALGLG
jgi:hypothetical protein